MDDRARLYMLASAAFLYMMGIGASLAVFPVAIREAGGSDLEVSVTIGIWALVYLIANIPMGYLTDRVGPRRTVFASFLLNAPLGLLFFYGRSTPCYMAGRAVEGVLEALIWTGVFGYIAKRYGEEKLRYFGLIYGSMALGFSIGPSLSVYLLDIFGLYSPFLLLTLDSAAASALSLASLGSLPYSSKPWRTAGGVSLSSRIIHPLVAVYVAVAYIIGTFESTLVSFSPMLASRMGLSSAMAGLILTLYYFMGLVGQFSLHMLAGVVKKSVFPLASYLIAFTLLASSTMWDGLFLPASIGIAGLVNAMNTSRIQGGLTSRFEESESTAVGVGNTGWALGYSSGAALYTLLVNPFLGVATWLALLAGMMALLSVFTASLERSS